MGQASSQLDASQAPTKTDGVPLTSQASSQIPQLDGTQDVEPHTQKRVDDGMNAIEDTVKKAKKKKGKNATRTGRKSVPQHLRGFAIRPSQEIPDTQEGERADAGAVDEREQLNGTALEQKDLNKEHVVSQSQEPASARKSRKQKRLHSDGGDVEPTAVNGYPDVATFNAINVNAVKESNEDPPLAKQHKRKRKEIELERLQRDAGDFAPDFESTPKPQPAVKRQKRAKVGKSQETTEEQPEGESSPQAVAPQSTVPQKDESPKQTSEDHLKIQDEVTGASKSQTKRARVKQASKPRSTRQGPADASSRRHQSTQNGEPDDLDAVDDHVVDHADAGAAAATDADPNAEARLADGMPTPPESPGHAAPNAASGDSDGDADEAQEDQRSAAPAQDTQQEILPATQEASKVKKSKKRKRAAEVPATSNSKNVSDDVTRALSEDHAENLKRVHAKTKKHKSNDKVDNDDAADHDHRQTSNDDNAKADENDKHEKKRARKKAKKAKKLPTDEVDYTKVSKEGRGEVSGMWSKEEKALADEIFDGVCRVTAVPPEELKVNMIDWRNPTPHLQQFKDELYEAFPKRDFKSIARFCQRRYNCYERGKWTEADDQRLREAYALNPDQWTAISDDVGRFWEDCRMRWRDVLSRTVKAETGPWSREEEKKLMEVVNECREIVLKETTDQEVRENLDKADALISWKVVAEKMGNTRVAKRCREKWAKIKHLDLSANVPATAATQTAESDKKPSKRLREIEALYQQCDTGDIYDILCEICTAIPDASRVFEQETTFWSVVAVRNPDSKFTSSLRRRAFWAALERYSCKGARNAETLAGKGHAVREKMEGLAGKGKVQMMRSYVAPAKKKAVKRNREGEGNEGDAVAGDNEAVAQKRRKSKKLSAKEGEANIEEVNQDPTGVTQEPAHKSKPKTRNPNAKSGFNYKSADIIVDSDDEDEVEINNRVTDTEQPAPERQPTEVRSLSDDDPGLHPSTFMELCTGEGKRARGKGKEQGKS